MRIRPRESLAGQVSPPVGGRPGQVSPDGSPAGRFRGL